MKVENFLRDKVFSMIIVFLGILILSCILLLVQLNIYYILFIIIIVIFLYILILLYDYSKRNAFYKNVSKLLFEMDKKYLIQELLKDSNFLEGNLLLEYMYDINKTYIEHLNEYKFANEEFKEYIELWCHEIKTPIATSKLIIDNNNSKVSQYILEEVEKIENYVLQVLYYARSENVDKDYIITKVHLKEVINNVIRNNKKDLINKKIKIQIFENDVIVNSDEKWLEYIINQIILNSIKYSKEENAFIKIFVKENINNVILEILDNGIGIKDIEIKDVFNKGFTGTNGRKKYVSTGMGLYLVKKLCNKLGVDVEIVSKENIETKVFIVFPNSSMHNIK